MKKLNFLLLIFFSMLSVQAAAKKMNYPIEVIAGMADLIVEGAISSIQSEKYSFKVSETIKGTSATEITVQKFREWKCDTRQKDFKKGQKLFLFLKKKGNQYEIINGSSGELFIENNRVDYVRLENKPDLISFKTAILNFTQCYQFVGDEYAYSESTFKMLKSDSEIEKLRNVNAISIEIFDRMKNYQVITG